jgi:hypothetical protein
MLRDDGKDVRFKGGRRIITAEHFPPNESRVVKKELKEGRQRSQQPPPEVKPQPTLKQAMLSFAENPSIHSPPLSPKSAAQKRNFRTVAGHFGRGMGWSK